MPVFRIVFSFLIVSGGKKVLFVIINLRLHNRFNESVELLDTIFDKVEGMAAKVVTSCFLIELRILSTLGFFCSTNVLPTYSDVCKHPNPNEWDIDRGKRLTSSFEYFKILAIFFVLKSQLECNIGTPLGVDVVPDV
tara:strand:- start:21 stop:431 length:411 start_codon:yes stop_codon:yes gene_type:complete